jgi:two-component system, cell cycle sensor histidine kinase and response regulator CckA
VKLMRATLPAGIHLATAFGADASRLKVLADPTQVHQVVMNLCANAAHAMEGKPGRIDIGLQQIELKAADSLDARKAWPAGLPPGRYVHLSVRDTGCGMDAGTLERIFDPFYTTKKVGEGTGLGLSVVLGIMQAHEGAITVDSRPEKGSTFHLYFPALELAVEGSEPEVPAPAVPAGRGQHVLYVDDDAALVSMVTRMLKRQGYRVSGHTWAREALEALRADPHQFDLVVTDYNMPGLSGLDMVHEVRAIRADLPVALTSGYITDELRQRAAESGVRHLIYKPNTVSELCEVVRALTSETGR